MTTWASLSLVLLVLATAVALPAWRSGWTPLTTTTMGAAVAFVALAAILGVLGEDEIATGPGAAAVRVAAVLASVAVGGPLTSGLLTLASRTPQGTGAAAEQAAEVLRGGAWIGALERAAGAATLLAGWPEGLAVLLAVKGLGRYPELRTPGAAERFIVGTLTSLLWAGACAGIAVLLVGAPEPPIG